MMENQANNFMTKKITLKGSYDLVKPDQMAQMANVLKSHVVKHKLYSPIMGKNYVQVEGWQFAGSLMGLFPMVSEVKDLSEGSKKKWQATVEIKNMKTGEVVGRGFAVCSNEENKKKSFDEYAVLSMAQTRATGKAYRNLIGWVMKLAGYEGTPSEEMVKAGDRMPSVSQEITSEDITKAILCSKCDAVITQQESDFSKRIYKKNLCRDCQKETKRK